MNERANGFLGDRLANHVNHTALLRGLGRGLGKWSVGSVLEAVNLNDKSQQGKDFASVRLVV